MARQSTNTTPAGISLIGEEIVIPIHFRDDIWSSNIGILQRSIDQLLPSSIKALHFDFTNCRWIDPLPALSMLIEMARAVHRGISVTASFPEPYISDTSVINYNQPYNSSPNKLLLFLAKEGYFNSILCHGVSAMVGKELLSEAVIKTCYSLKATLSYSDASIIPIHLYDVPRLGDEVANKRANQEFAADAVTNLLSGVEPSLRSKCSAPERRQLLYTLRAVLQEFLHNVQEHAYESDDFRPAAIYVRFRKGLVGLSSSSEKKFYEGCVNEENQHCIRIGNDWLNAKRGCLEVFFLDRGVGISSKFPGIPEGDNKFRTVMESTFSKGISSKPKRTTEHGGLHLLHTLMSRRNDYLRVLEDRNFFGAAVPFQRPESSVVRPIPNLAVGQGLIGFAYHVRLSWKSSTDDGDNWLGFTETEVEKIFKQNLCQSEDDEHNLFAKTGRVVDERFRFSNADYEKVTEHSYLLWLPPRNLMKWDILDKLEKLASTINFFCTLVIADIPSIEAATFEAAISKADFNPNETWPNKFKAIVLATNRWSFAYAEYTANLNGSHGFTPLSRNEIPKKFKPGVKQNIPKSTFRELVVDWLKSHDSECFWEEAHTSGRLYLAEKVTWEEDENHNPTLEIDGYLDFPSASHNRYCAALLRNALGRILGLLGEKTSELVPVDGLAAPIVHDVYANEAYDPPTHGQEHIDKIAVGSVLVSGATLSATGLSEKSIHFFVHRNSPLAGKHPSLFHWTPGLDIEGTTGSQKRIGKTSAIAPEGWLSIEVPRHHDKKILEGGRLPAEAYEDWQSPGPVIVKAGHWCYEGHHDFLTINIPDAVDDAFARNGPLAQFLVQHVLYHLDVGLQQFSQQVNNTYANYPNIANANKGILVYRSHPSSERIMERILSVLSEDARREVGKWIFPVLPLRMRWGGSTLLIPPRMRDEIGLALKERPHVMIFDDAAISGRTIQDLLTSLKALGSKPISVLVIANRLRLPAETGTVKYFWRLDAPTMGREKNCPLCQALDTARSFAGTMVHSSEAYKDVLRWICAWEAASPLSKWDAGLDPLPLPERQFKEYCYHPDSKKYLAQIPIYRATGLMIHIAELHAMTVSDNYGLKKIRALDDPAIQIGVAASQLLLFADELDQDLIRDIAIEGLLLPMARLPDDSPYGPLAMFVLMKTLSSTLESVQLELAGEAKKIIGELSSLRHGQILIAFLVGQRLLDWTDNACYAGIRLLSTRHRHIADKLRSLFRETVSPAGKIHSEPIPRLIDTLKNSDATPTENLVWSALASIASLKDIMLELGADMATSDGGMSYTDRRQALERGLIEAEVELKELLEVFATGITKLSRMNVLNSLNNVKQHLESIADCYFHRISSDENPKGILFKEQLATIWNSQIDWGTVLASKKEKFAKHRNYRDKPPIICHSSDSGCSSDFGNAEWVWIPWVKQIRMIASDLIVNSIYCQKTIQDPWAPSTETADMWVHVRFEPKSVCISLADSCKGDQEKIFEDVKENTIGKTRWDVIVELGGSIQLGDIKKVGNDDIFVITVKLPYAPFLGNKIEERYSL